ncbi:UNVERIFIED_CONTAM: hypothetical protein GTU68_055401 [Idotea baltica]|nr:hypothetical protein [Idotea baltica]
MLLQRRVSANLR